MAEDEEGTAKPATAVDEADDGTEDGDAEPDFPEEAPALAVEPLPTRGKGGTLAIVGVVVAMLGVFAYFKLRTPEEEVPPAVWARYHDVANTFSLEMPAQPVQSSDPQATLMARLGSRDYAVTWAPIGDLERWKKIEEAVVEKGTVTRQLSIPDSDASFVFKTPQGMFAAVRAVRRDNVGYLILTGAYIDDPDLERPLRTFRFEPAPP